MSQESAKGNSKTLLGEGCLGRVVGVVGGGAAGRGLDAGEVAGAVVQLGVLQALVEEEGDGPTPGPELDADILVPRLHELGRSGVLEGRTNRHLRRSGYQHLTRSISSPNIEASRTVFRGVKVAGFIIAGSIEWRASSEAPRLDFQQAALDRNQAATSSLRFSHVSQEVASWTREIHAPLAVLEAKSSSEESTVPGAKLSI
jgi:hypothetical protein